MAGTLTGDSWAVVVAVLLLAAMGLQCAVDEMGPGGVAVFVASGSPVLILFLTWRRLGDGVKPGFVASMYLHSTILGVALSLVGELLASSLWSRTFPDCNLGLGGSSQMVISPMTERCEVLGLAAWLCIPGVFEETFKVVWVFYRLRRSLKDVPETCCCGACWSVSSMDCGWWFKLAPTPQHVLLAAVAAGAGFEAAENLNYGLATEDVALALPLVIMRGLYPLHICWTGMIGVGLARRLFLPRDQGPSLFAILWPAVLLHGLNDYCAILIQTFGTEGDYRHCAQAVVLELFIWTISISRFAVASGLRVTTPRSCCCARAVWEAQFQQPLVGEAFAANLQNPLLDT